MSGVQVSETIFHFDFWRFEFYLVKGIVFKFYPRVYIYSMNNLETQHSKGINLMVNFLAFNLIISFK